LGLTKNGRAARRGKKEKSDSFGNEESSGTEGDRGQGWAGRPADLTLGSGLADLGGRELADRKDEGRQEEKEKDVGGAKEWRSLGLQKTRQRLRAYGNEWEGSRYERRGASLHVTDAPNILGQILLYQSAGFSRGGKILSLGWEGNPARPRERPLFNKTRKLGSWALSKNQGGQ